MKLNSYYGCCNCCECFQQDMLVWKMRMKQEYISAICNYSPAKRTLWLQLKKMQYQWMLMISGLLKDQKLHDHLRLQQKCYVKQLVVIWRAKAQKLDSVFSSEGINQPCSVYNECHYLKESVVPSFDLRGASCDLWGGASKDLL